MVTKGQPWAAVTAGVGFHVNKGTVNKQPLTLLGGEYRVSNTVKLLSENYFVPKSFFSLDADILFLSFGIRIFSNRFVANLGVYGAAAFDTPPEFFAFPLLSFSYSFGR